MDIARVSTEFWLFRYGKNEILIGFSFFYGEKAEGNLATYIVLKKMDILLKYAIYMRLC